MRATALRATLPAVLLLALAVGGCSVSVGTGDGDGGDGADGADKEPISATRLAEQVADKQQVQNPDKKISDVSCDGELAPVEDAEQLCHASDALGDRYGITVRVTGVTDERVSFRTFPDPGQTVEPDELEPAVIEQLTKLSGGTTPDALDCPDELPGRIDATTTCVLTAGEDRIEVTVTVTAAEGPDVGFDIDVADQPLP